MQWFNMVSVRYLAGIVLTLFSTGAFAQAEVVVTRTYSNPGQGVGVEYRRDVAAANKAMADDHDLERAAALLAPVMRYCDQQQRPGRVAISVASVAEYERYMAEHGNGVPVEWIDMVCPDSYKTAAFLHVEKKEYDAALPLLEKAIAMAPYWPNGLAELGFVLNQQHKPQEALMSYRKSLSLAETFDSGKPMKALALRGIGYSLIELGDLAGARKTYEQSLEIDPGNKTALNELDYIRQQEAKAQP
jgi:tetratricopeptide (TPR) repeat protein